MSTFEEIVGKHEQNNSLSERLKFEELVRLIEEVHAEKPRVLKENKKPKEVRLLTPDFRIDPSWMSIDEGNYSRERDKLNMAIEATGIPRNIEELQNFVGAMNNLLTEEVDVSDHSIAMSKIQVLRIFYNLARAPDEAVAGFLFESLMALVFGGKRIPPDSKEMGVVDVVFPGRPISMKFIQSTVTDIKGSYSRLYDAVKASSNGVIEYIIADKVGDVINFYSFFVDNDESSPNFWKKMPPVKSKKDPTQYRVRLNTLRKMREIRDLPTLNFNGIESKTEEILNALDEKFESLLTTLLDLNDKANELFYTAKSSKETKKHAGETAKKAEYARASAERIKGK